MASDISVIDYYSPHSRLNVVVAVVCVVNELYNDRVSVSLYFIGLDGSFPRMVVVVVAVSITILVIVHHHRQLF